LEEAEGLLRLKESHGYDDSELAEVVGKNRATVNETLRLNDLPEPIKQDARGREIPRLLLVQVVRVDDEQERQSFWEAIKRGEISTVRQAKERRKAPKGEPGEAKPRPNPVLFAGQTFVERLEKVPDEDLLADQALYSALTQLGQQIAKRLSALRKAAQRPTAPTVAEPTPEGGSTQPSA
jgi:ParB family chromosome partitioning protein